MTTSPRLVVATGNPHKVEEIRSILTPYFSEAILADIAPLGQFTREEPVEDGVTFEANSLIKARAACRLTGLPALADDSGIAVDVLGGAPGVFSARWCGHHGDDRANRELLLAQLADVPDQHRGCAFVACVTLVLPDGREFATEGRVKGHLARQSSGSGGFGYDPIFVPDGFSVTTAQLSPAEKNALSHRGQAVRLMVEHLQELLGD